MYSFHRIFVPTMLGRPTNILLNEKSFIFLFHSLTLLIVSSHSESVCRLVFPSVSSNGEGINYKGAFTAGAGSFVGRQAISCWKGCRLEIGRE